jgi:hypothetical protein
VTLGRAVAGLNAYSKGVSLGLFQPSPREVKEQRRKMRKEETWRFKVNRGRSPREINSFLKGGYHV